MSTTTATEIAPLTADDVRALRTASQFTVCLDNGTAKLRASRRLRAKSLGPFGTDETEVHREIPAEAYTTERAHFCALYPAGQWTALALIVRAGDRLIFRARTNNNGYLDAATITPGRLDGHYTGYAALYCDELTATIVRNGRTIVREMVLAHSICPDNSARAIR